MITFLYTKKSSRIPFSFHSLDNNQNWKWKIKIAETWSHWRTWIWKFKRKQKSRWGKKNSLKFTFDVRDSLTHWNCSELNLKDYVMIDFVLHVYVVIHQTWLKYQIDPIWKLNWCQIKHVFFLGWRFFLLQQPSLSFTLKC